MTDKINMVINLSILALLIYLAIQVHQLKNPPKYQPAMMGMLDSKVELEYKIQTLLNDAIKKAIEAE